jgi:hypothetical protein
MRQIGSRLEVPGTKQEGYQMGLKRMGLHTSRAAHCRCDAE